MRMFEHSYIDGRFVKTLGTDTMDIINPSTEAIIGRSSGAPVSFSTMLAKITIS